MGTQRTRSTILRDIKANSTHILDRLSSFKPSNSAQLMDDSIPSLTLPEPRSITRELFEKGLHPSLVQELSRLYMQNAKLLKAEYERNMQTTTRKYVHAGVGAGLKANFKAIRSAYLASYSQALHSCADFSVTMSCQHVFASMDNEPSLGDFSTRNDKRITFRQEVVHVLEETFRVNQYPSRALKFRLACQTGMEYRQIDIWFQNRRTRKRRRGREIPKIAFAFADSSSSDTFDGAYRTWHTDAELDSLYSEHDTNASPNISRSNSLKDSNILDTPAPPHTFPGPYPPDCEYEPFPTGTAHLETNWYRHPAPQHNLHLAIQPNIDHLVFSLTGLTLVESTTSAYQHTPTICQAKGDSPAACLPFLRVAPPAPLPSLIRTSTGVNRTASLKSAISVQCLSHIDSPPETIITPALSTYPRRNPRSAPTLARNSRHPYPTSSLRQSARLSRLSSASSISSLSSDSSSSPSSPDTPLMTPPPLHADLPQTSNFSTSAFDLRPTTCLATLYSASPKESSIYLQALVN